MAMAVSDIVTDPFLRSVLEVSNLTREQCITLLDEEENHQTRLSIEPSTRALQAELIKHWKSLNSYLGQLRGSNREAILRVRHTKQATADARQEVDRLHLQLQNLYYEQRHLRGEIAACEAYE